MKTVTCQTEVCIGSVASAIEAARGGAQRVELCDNLLEGGTTPSAGSIQACLNIPHLKTMVMIRPRGGDFLYNETEFDIMKRDVIVARELGAHGVVFGILLADGTIDRVRMMQLVELSGSMDITCHRAFDMTRDPFEAMECLIGMGIKRILTSGQQPKAPLGAALITKLIEKAGDRIIIMPGAGVNETTIEKMAATGAREFHIAPTRSIDSEMVFRNSSISMGTPEQPEYKTIIVDLERIKKVTDYLNQL
ncbi:MAG: copper homeostasis protein CutC [Bacteroidetes bacterium HGW-Bacteroidetes-22]|nr:MAG: copper homeostasis protein CutC [Bacteroidetes bacterium HGW-Bacteroidetes-22]